MDASFQLLRRFYPQLVTVSAVAMAPGVFARIALREQLGDPTAMVAHPYTSASVVLLGLLCFAVAEAVLVVATSQGYLEGTVDLPRALAAGWRRLGTVIAAIALHYLASFGLFFAVIVGVGVVVALLAKSTSGVAGLLFLFVPLGTWLAMYVGLRTFAVANAVLLDNLGPIAAFRRTWVLSKDCAAHIFFSLALAYLLYFIIAIIAVIIGTKLFNPALTQILSSLMIIPVYPLLAVVSTLLYYDLRIRKEGFDLEMMSRDLGAGAPAPIPAM